MQLDETILTDWTLSLAEVLAVADAVPPAIPLVDPVVPAVPAVDPVVPAVEPLVEGVAPVVDAPAEALMSGRPVTAI